MKLLLHPHIKESNVHVLQQLLAILDQLDNTAYSSKLDVLSASSIGMHVRHILEFYTCLFMEADIINYDNRKRNLRLETDTDYAIENIVLILATINNIEEDKMIQLAGTESFRDETYMVTTTLSRELQYLSEHSIHHMAIIKIALQSSFPTVNMHQHFGIAFATIKHQQNVHSNVLPTK
jgi:hypothetical protein